MKHDVPKKFLLWIPMLLAASSSVAQLPQRVADAAVSVPDTREAEAVLARPVTLVLDHVSLDRAIHLLATSANAHMQYRAELIDAYPAPVSARFSKATLGSALEHILAHTNVRIVPLSDGNIGLADGTGTGRAVVADSITGHVVDSRTKAPIPNVIIAIPDKNIAVRTRENGTYVMVGVSGPVTLVVRRIGYTRQVRSVVVDSGATVVADFSMEPSASQLDQIVVTGTAIPTEVRAVPNPITVISAKQIAEQHINNIDDLYRFMIPGGVMADVQPGIGGHSAYSVRGVSTFDNALSTTFKVLVDGVQLADASQLRTIDPASIDHVEVLTGPEATTIYGSGAISGVMQIFLKHGNDANQPQISGHAELGTIDNKYNPGTTPLTKNGGLTLSGGNTAYGYSAGATWEQEGAWERFNKAESTALFGNARFEQGIWGGDFSIRNTRTVNHTPIDPTANGADTISVAPRDLVDYRFVTYAGILRVQPVQGWVSALTLGEDQDLYWDYSSRAATAADAAAEYVPEGTYNNYQDNTISRTVDFKSSYQWTMTPAFSMNVTGGATQILSKTNYIQATDSATPINSSTTTSVYFRNSETLTRGLYGQAQLSWRNVLFLTAGAHGDRSPGEDGTVWSPRVGLSAVRDMGSVTLKGRIEYGSSLIAPDPQNKVYQVVRSNEYQLANPDLQPEVQRGTDMGLEVYFGNLWSLGVTYYNQMTQDLTTETDSTDGTNYYLQYQNVGRAHNTGVEFTGTLNPISSLSLQVVYGSARSFIQTLSPSYQGDYHAGDRVLGIPEWTGGATAVWTPWHGTTLNVAATHTARQFNVDYIGLFAAFDDGSYTGSERDYWKWYPSFTLVNTGITQRITANVSGYVQIANAGNSYAAQGVNIFSQRGRLSTVGLQWHF